MGALPQLTVLSYCAAVVVALLSPVVLPLIPACVEIVWCRRKGIK